MKLIPDWLISALQDGGTPPNYSMSRVLAFIVTVAVVVLPSIAIIELTLIQGKPVAIPEGWVPFVAAAQGFTLAMFAANKRSE